MNAARKMRSSRSVSLGTKAIEILDAVRDAYRRETGKTVGYTNAVYLLAGRAPQPAARRPSQGVHVERTAPHDIVLEIVLAPGSSGKDHNFDRLAKFGLAYRIWEDERNRRITISMPFWPPPWRRTFGARGGTAGQDSDRASRQA